MELTRPQMIIIGSAVFTALLLIGIFTGILPGTREKLEKVPSLTLKIWGIESRPAMQDLISGYENIRKNVRVDYEEINPETYEQDVINALATGNGPDIIMFHSSWLPKHYNKIIPLKDEQMNLVTFQDTFPTIAEQDFIGSGKIYALPMYIDTLALYYNQDTFDKNGIAVAPKDWLDLQNLIPKLRQKDSSGKIIKPAVAIGGSESSVNNASDILSLLMLQAGANMTDESFTQATFSGNVEASLPGLDALKFYSKFTDPEEIYYNWTDSNEYSLDSFAKGDTAMIFAYNSQKNYLKDKNPFLKFKVALMPQPTGSEKAVNYSDYWGLAVTSNSKNPDWAWDAILYLTANQESAEKYLLSTDNPPAMRSLIQKYVNHPELGVFAKQALSARSWPQIDGPAIKNIFSRMISATINRELTPQDAISQAEREVTELMQARKQ